MKRVVQLLLVAISLVSVTDGLAVQVKGLYHTEVAIIDGQTKQEQLLVKAFKHVLVKVSGNPNITEISAVIEQLPSAKQYIEQYSTTEHTVDGSQQQYLTVNFNPGLVNGLLQRINQPQWGKERPLTITLVEYQQYSDREFLGSESDSAVTKFVKQSADYFALPIVFPVFDLDDLTLISPYDIQENNIEKIWQIADRYQAQAALILRVQQVDDNLWKTRWTLNVPNHEPIHWHDEQDNLHLSLKQGFAELTEILAKQFVKPEVSQLTHAQVLMVDNIKSLEDYSKVLQYLKKLSVVKSVNVINVSAQHVTYLLRLNGDKQTLENSLRYDGMVRSMASTDEETLNYQLRS